MVKVAFCQATFKRDWERTKQHIRDWLPYVDYVIIVVDETVSSREVEEVKRQFNSPKLIIKHVKFPESLPEFRNYYVKECIRLGVDWFVVSDPDEFHNDAVRRDIYKICMEAEKKGFTQLGVNCHEQFEPIEWLPLDKLDELKEYPGGYRESNYYKMLIQKLCCEKFSYVGVGRTKTVHESWGCPIHPQRGVYLPKDKYWYTHIKSAYDIFRNAARNLFLGGGGDNVGDLNEMWVELKEICKELNLNTWREFEEYITSTDKLDESLIDWVKRGLTWKATDFGIETRETCKWIIFHHRELLEDPEIEEGIRNPPKLTEEDKVESYVRRMYFQVLGRHPDRSGLEYYKKAILEGKLSKEALPLALKTSPEYAEKFGQPEKVRMQIPVNVDIGVTTDTFIEAMRRSGTFWKKIKPAIDIGRFVMDMLSNNWRDFERWFYQNRDKITLADFIEKLREASG